MAEVGFVRQHEDREAGQVGPAGTLRRGFFARLKEAVLTDRRRKANIWTSRRNCPRLAGVFLSCPRRDSNKESSGGEQSRCERFRKSRNRSINCRNGGIWRAIPRRADQFVPDAPRGSSRSSGCCPRHLDPQAARSCFLERMPSLFVNPSSRTRPTPRDRYRRTRRAVHRTIDSMAPLRCRSRFSSGDDGTPR
jgi:hypothetical protein